MENTDIIRVAFYIRVSTTEQGTKGYGLDYQLQALNDLVKYRSNQNPKWITNKKWLYEDSGYSGGDLNRPAYMQMIEDAKNGEFDMIAVWKIDRMSRNLSHLLKTFEDLKQYGVGFYSVKENIDFSGPIGKLTFQIFGALAEFEREMIKSRTIEGKIASARMGNYIQGSAPFGYEKVKNENGKGSKLVIVREEIAIVKKIFEWFIYNNLSYSEIMRKLNDMKIPKGKGGVRKNIEFTDWYDTTVKDVLERSIYAGTIEELFKKDGEEYIVIIPTPKIISKSLYNLAQAKIKEIEEEKKGGKRKYLLSGKMYDPIELTERGEMRKFIGVIRTKGGHSYRRDKFIRSNGEEVQNKEFSGKAIDDFVWGYILEFVKNPERFYKTFKKQTTELNNIDRYREEIEILERKIDEEELIKVNIEKKEISGRLSQEKADMYILESNKNISNFEKKINILNQKIDNLLNLELIKDVVDDISNNFSGKVDNLNFEQKMRLVDILVDKVLVYYDGDGIKEVEVLFRFNVEDDNNTHTDLELKKGLDKQKTPKKGVINCEYGTPGRFRTHDL